MEEKVKKILISILVALTLVVALGVPAMAAEQSTTATVSVGEVISITLVGSINFGSVTPPVTDNGTIGQVDLSPAIKVNVGIETNVSVDIGIKGALATGSLALTNWKYSTTFAGSKTSIPSAYGTAVYTSAAAGSSNFFYHWLTVPLGTLSGSHTVTVSYKAVKAGTGL
jgi:hypothetical protein